ncbi:hypothetical protein [Amycolatopsis panacis]|uniref:Diacylglycerol kinase n=1 Tax=Amycolatopsis panacis TaxID=2340917 RepID=A0A419I2Z2_9PSEU|nr:hypothetical protein [Amycolatopsis panacis]RJQ84411.1 hypothetical protein D5S19_17425 [Amycolatopsis panacis]
MTVTEDPAVRGTVVACGAAGQRAAAGAELPVTAAGTRPGKPEIDSLLGEYDRLVVAGTDGDLAAVVVRIMRRERLADVSLGYLPVAPSPAAARWQLPADPSAALALAAGGADTAVPLVRDDTGGVLLGAARLEAVKGQAYCDEQVAFDGEAAAVEIAPDDAGVLARVTRGRFLKRTATFHGRAFQIGCLPTSSLVIDGIPAGREITRRTWYRHTADLRLVRG